MLIVPGIQTSFTHVIPLFKLDELLMSWKRNIYRNLLKVLFLIASLSLVYGALVAHFIEV